MNNNKKEFWNSAARDGLFFGLALVVLVFLGVAFRLDLDHGAVSSMLSFLVIAMSVSMFSKKRSLSRGKLGYSYGQSMGYILAIAAFAGFIFGVGQFFVWNYVAPEYYQEILDKTIEIARVSLEADINAEMALDIYQKMVQNPVVIVISSIFTVMCYSCFIGLLVSVFVKRFPQLDENNE
ncbi:MAG: DUF4199 domain-containing protein [Rikenellaceae bacterium]